MPTLRTDSPCRNAPGALRCALARVGGAVRRTRRRPLWLRATRPGGRCAGWRAGTGSPQPSCSPGAGSPAASGCPSQSRPCGLVEAFHTTPATVKLTLTVYFGGFAFAQLVCGPLSDALGRRPAALGFFSVYSLGSVIAAVSPAIAWLVVGRMLQGIGVAAGIAISRAIVRDQFTGQQSARIMNLIGLMLAIGPAVSPALGGVILSTVGWHAIFLVMVAYGIVVVLVLGFAVRETNRAPGPTKAHPSQIARSYLILLHDRGFMRAGLLLGLMLGGLYTLALLLPFVMIDLVGLTPTQFGLAMICQTGSYMLGPAVTGRALRRIPAARLIPVGVVLGVVAGLWLAIGLRLVRPSFISVIRIPGEGLGVDSCA